MPFALLAATQLAAVGAFIGLAGVATRPPVRRRGGLGAASTALFVVGALAVAAADAVTGARLGPTTNDVLVAVQAAGLVVLAAGIAVRTSPAPAALSVAPLGAAVPPSAVGVAGGIVAAALLWRQRDLPRLALAVGLGGSGLALGLAPLARTHAAAAITLLALRAVGALGILAAIGVLARTSVLGKVVTAIGVGVLVTAIGTAAVVGTVVGRQLADDQSRQLRQAAVGAATDLGNEAATAGQLAKQASACPPSQTLLCAQGIANVAPADAFAAVIDPAGTVTFAGGADRLDEDRAALLDLATTPAVTDARSPVPGHPYVAYGFVLLHGRQTQLVALGVASVSSTNGVTVVAYGVQVDTSLLQQTRARSTFDATVLGLPDGAPLASSLPAAAARVLASAARPLLASIDDPTVATSRIGQGTMPSAAYVLLPSGSQRVAVLALSGSSASVLQSQRTVLGLLFTALLVIGAVVALAAYLLGRRAVEPVRRLTVAARKVGDGDLTVRLAPDTVDEVGELASVFSAMTTSLEFLTDDLRTTAETEAATRERLGTVIDAMADALVVAGPDGVVDLANPAATEMFGPLVGLDVDTVLLDTSGAPLTVGEVWAETKAGPTPVVVARAQLPARRGTVHVLRDVTATHQLERAKTEFLSNVSHELRTPLTPIQGYADLLRRRTDLPASQVQAMAESISDGARRMARVVGLLVDVAALDAGRVRPAPETVQPAAFLDARIAAWKKRAPGQSVRRRVTAGTPELLADPEWLARAMDELIDNAVNHGRTAVTLLAAPGARGRVVLSVKDSGPGLDEDEQAALFDDFAQVDGSATRSRDGLGLGLAFVQRVCAVLDAHVSVSSKAGAGAVFALDLPAATRAPRPRRTTTSKAARG